MEEHSSQLIIFLTPGLLEEHKSMLNVKEFQLTISKPLKSFSNQINKQCKTKIQINSITMLAMRGIVIKEYFWKTHSLQEWNFKHHPRLVASKALVTNHHKIWMDSRQLNLIIKIINRFKMYIIHQVPKNNKLQELAVDQDLVLEIWEIKLIIISIKVIINL